MRITCVNAYRVRIPFRSPFVHALYARHETNSIVVTVESEEGEVGVGEILPRAYLTGETLTAIWHHGLPTLAERWVGRSFANRNEVLLALAGELNRSERALASLAGWELAILDLSGKTFGFSVGEILGSTELPEVPAGVVIDFAIPTNHLEKHCSLLRLVRQHYIKIKVGLPDDLQRLEVIQGVLGPEQPLRLDANAAWTPEKAICTLRTWRRRLNIGSIEQPVAANDIQGMRAVRTKTGVPVVADESLCTLDDAKALIRCQAADILNIRIGKMGGLAASARIIQVARDAGLRCELATLVGETGILSRAAEILSRRIEGFEFLEGKGQNRKLLTEDLVDLNPPVTEVAPAGLGIHITANLGRLTVCVPLSFKMDRRSLE
jgi:L-alanine-DL-glutamate epimerase-like enolase superfamily enzyme